MQDMTPTQRLADNLLDGGLAAFVTDARAKGDSWRRISLALRDRIGLDVTYQTLANWYGHTADAPRLSTTTA